MANNQRVALVTGASRGIGAEVARRLAKDGFAVAINYSSNQQAAEAVQKEIEASNGVAAIFQANVASSAEVDRMFTDIKAKFGGIDVLINNAGVMALGPLAAVTDEVIDKHIDINLKGSLYALRAAAQHLNNGGRVVNLSTTVVGLKLENYSVYAATKGAIEVATGILAKEMRGRNITVNAVAPGPTATDLFLEGKPQEVIERMSKMSPLERLGKPSDIAGSIAFLVGPDGGWINGQTLRANGGLV